ncbi:MAG: hypothetical protein E7263_09845 [Lachnospiraceae bacterium]|nr:hypothetical protein [Lachnospiraceae bacterium]
MDSVKEFFQNLLDQVPNFISALLLLLVAFLVATIVKSIVGGILKKLNAEAFLARFGIRDTETNSSIDFVAKLAYFVVFLMFLPGVFEKVGMHSISTPISNLVNSFINAIPNIVSAIIILIAGLFVAKIIKQLLLPLLRVFKVDDLQIKFGIVATENNLFSNVIANVLYGLMVLVVVVSAVEKLGVAAISGPANAIVSTVFATLPKVLGAIAVIALGLFIAKLVGRILYNLLASVGTDNLVEKITGNSEKKVYLSWILSEVVRYVIIVIFIVQGINMLELAILTSIGATIIAYLPAVVSAILIFGVGVFAAKLASEAIVKKNAEAKAVALAAKVAIYVVTAFICLSQLGIAGAMVETTFILIVAAVCVASAIAFGIGGRTFAANTLAKLEKKLDDKDAK